MTSASENEQMALAITASLYDVDNAGGRAAPPAQGALAPQDKFEPYHQLPPLALQTARRLPVVDLEFEMAVAASLAECSRTKHSGAAWASRGEWVSPAEPSFANPVALPPTAAAGEAVPRPPPSTTQFPYPDTKCSRTPASTAPFPDVGTGLMRTPAGVRGLPKLFDSVSAGAAASASRENEYTAYYKPETVWRAFAEEHKKHIASMAYTISQSCSEIQERFQAMHLATPGDSIRLILEAEQARVASERDAKMEYNTKRMVACREFELPFRLFA